MQHRTGIAPFAIIALGLGLLTRTLLAQDESKSALETDPQGWLDIFPAGDLTGWTRLPIPPTAKLGGPQWTVDTAHKLLICDGTGGHDWLRYDRELGDFIFHVEWRYTPVPGKTGYNSGVFVRNSSDARIWHQAQVGSSSGGYLFGDTPLDGKVQRFNFRDQVKQHRVRPAGEWNTYEITCRGKTISLWVNGAVTNRWTECPVPRGHIGVEGEGWRIEFKNLRLKELR